MHLIKGEFIGVLYAYLSTRPYNEVKELIEELKTLQQVPDELLEKLEEDGQNKNI